MVSQAEKRVAEKEETNPRGRRLRGWPTRNDVDAGERNLPAARLLLEAAVERGRQADKERRKADK